MSKTSNYRIRKMLLSDMQWLSDSCGKEGWNPGVAEGPAYVSLDPEGLFLGEWESRRIGSLFGVKIGERLAHMGCYLILPSHRGRGLGLSLFDHALSRICNETVGLDAVSDQQENYRKQGFQPFASSFRMRYAHRSKELKPSCDLISISQIPLADLAPLEFEVFATQRLRFLAEWVRIPTSRGVVAVRNSKIVGYGHIRPARDGFRAGPLVADSVFLAEEILDALCVRARAQTVDLDICAANPSLEDLSRHLSLKPVLETARMYRGPLPKLNWTKQFAIAGMEIG